MKRILAVLTLLAVSGALLVGCGDEAARNRMCARKELEPALTKVRLAALTPDTTKTGENLERQKKLDEALPALEALAKNAASDQQGAVLDLLAQVEQTRAQDIGRQARGAWAALTNKQIEVLTDLTALGAASDRVAGFTVPNKKDVEQLQTYLGQLADQVKTTEDQLKTITTQIQAKESERSARLSERDAAKKQWQTIMDQAAVKQGQEQLDLYKQGVDLQSKADVAATAADLIDATLSGMKSEKAVLDQRLALAQAAQKEAQRQIAAANERIADFEKARSEALGQGEKPGSTSQAALLKDFEAAFQALDADYQAKVETVLDQAAAKASLAVAHLQAAETLPGDVATKRAFKAMRLAATDNQASLATQEILIVGQYARFLQKAAGLAEDLKLPQAAAISAAAKRVADKQGKLVATFGTQINAALALANTVSTNAADDPAVRQAGHLREYLQMVAQANVSGTPMVPEAPGASEPTTPAPTPAPATTRPGRTRGA